MRNTIFALLGAIALMGCTSEPEPQVAPAFPENQGQPGHNAKAFPAGPYGVGKGSIIANYEFVGYVNAVVDNETLVEIEMADFYNPTGDGVYEEGSIFPAGTPKPKALVLNVGSVWCPPCNEEADKILPGKYLKYKPMGGEFLMQLADGPTPGKPATQKSLYNWTTKYEVDYPSTIDPTYKLGALFESDSFPANMIIDTRTMQIVDVLAGTPDAGFWVTFEKTLAGTP